MNWHNVLPWEDLRLDPQDAPGWLARGVIFLARWVAANLVPIALVVGTLVAFLAAAGLLVGAVDRDGALARLKRVLFALAVVAVVATGTMVTLALLLGQALQAGLTGG